MHSVVSAKFFNTAGRDRTWNDARRAGDGACDCGRCGEGAKQINPRHARLGRSILFYGLRNCLRVCLDWSRIHRTTRWSNEEPGYGGRKRPVRGRSGQAAHRSAFLYRANQRARMLRGDAVRSVRKKDLTVIPLKPHANSSRTGSYWFLPILHPIRPSHSPGLCRVGAAEDQSRSSLDPSHLGDVMAACPRSSFHSRQLKLPVSRELHHPRRGCRTGVKPLTNKGAVDVGAWVAS
jgi:hypothetical protein